MEAYHVIHNGQLYRLTRKAEERLLLLWARTGQRPDFTTWKGVKPLGAVHRIDQWGMREVEQGMMDFLRRGRSREAP